MKNQLLILAVLVVSSTTAFSQVYKYSTNAWGNTKATRTDQYGRVIP